MFSKKLYYRATKHSFFENRACKEPDMGDYASPHMTAEPNGNRAPIAQPHGNTCTATTTTSTAENPSTTAAEHVNNETLETYKPCVDKDEFISRYPHVVDDFKWLLAKYPFEKSKVKNELSHIYMCAADPIQQDIMKYIDDMLSDNMCLDEYRYGCNNLLNSQTSLKRVFKRARDEARDDLHARIEEWFEDENPQMDEIDDLIDHIARYKRQFRIILAEPVD